MIACDFRRKFIFQFGICEDEKQSAAFSCVDNLTILLQSSQPLDARANILNQTFFPFFSFFACTYVSHPVGQGPISQYIYTSWWAVESSGICSVAFANSHSSHHHRIAINHKFVSFVRFYFTLLLGWFRSCCSNISENEISPITFENNHNIR